MKFKLLEIPVFNDHERFFSKIVINKETECWEWQRNICESGYGTFSIYGRMYKSHRISYSIFKNDLTGLLVIDHVCRNRKCCNPDHLRAVDIYTNTTQNSLCGAAINKSKTHCIRGHELSDPNIIKSIMRSGMTSRICRTFANHTRRIRRANGKKD